MSYQAGLRGVRHLDELVFELPFEEWLDSIGHAQDVGDVCIFERLKVVCRRYVAKIESVYDLVHYYLINYKLINSKRICFTGTVDLLVAGLLTIDNLDL